MSMVTSKIFQKRYFLKEAYLSANITITYSSGLNSCIRVILIGIPISNGHFCGFRIFVRYRLNCADSVGTISRKILFLFFDIFNRNTGSRFPVSDNKSTSHKCSALMSWCSVLRLYFIHLSQTANYYFLYLKTSILAICAIPLAKKRCRGMFIGFYSITNTFTFLLIHKF